MSTLATRIFKNYSCVVLNVVLVFAFFFKKNKKRYKMDVSCHFIILTY